MEVNKSRYISILRDIPIFQGLEDDQVNEVLHISNIIEVDDKNYIIKEGDVDTSFYVLLSGKAQCFNERSKSVIAAYKTGDVIGQLAAIDHQPRSASIVATEKCTLLVVSLDEIRPKNFRDTYSALLMSLSKSVSNFLRDTNQKREALFQEHIKAGVLSMIIICSTCIFCFILKFLQNMPFIGNEIFYLCLMLSLVTSFLFLTIKYSGYKKDFYGITMVDWKLSIKEGVLFTLPILAVSIFAKWCLIHFTSGFDKIPLFQNLFTTNPLPIPKQKLLAYLTNLMIYLSTCPLQELAARGILQNLMKKMLSDSKPWLYILGSNLIFSITHLYLSSVYAFSALIPGLFWGYLYNRHKSLIGVSISHIVIGVFVIYVLGIKGILIS